ncbi:MULTISPECIES: DUF4012 domain-containing protein [Bifidobacterium]|uniref:DUF4012 domain-containing protein n=1 Tax=Bifidobacterium tibiigranuli TaxID=2172043 RepID=A0A5N6RZV3_9BIFI|nr:DUF4012 domain-containing protein [Bifidobacterium tibiigranuli]KAE8127537.1 DUF4012 domain-containing protein [Bifidobacterium tibiigranuli]KAE8127986.1 chemotaxis protein [Bifidobacterium tibiigranuli]
MATSRHANSGHRSRRHRVWPWVTGVVVLLLALVAVAGVFGLKFYSEAKQVREHSQNAMQMMSGFSDVTNADAVRNLNSQLPSIRHETGEAKSIAHGRLWNVAAKLPKVGNDVTTVQGMTTSLDGIVNDAVPGFVNAVTGLQSSQLSTGDGQLNLQPILDAQKNITSANAALQQQVAAFNALPTPSIGAVKDSYTSARESLNSVAKKTDALSKAMNILPDFLGSSQPRTYLIMSMTTSEARSSGGLIGSVGVMTTDNGKISIGNFRPNTEYIPYGSGDPTADEQRIFRQWGPLSMSFDIRDLAVYPDTSRTAEGMQAIWQRTPWGSGQPIDGVLLIDPVFLQELISINGNVKLSDGRVLNGQNTAEFLLNTVYKEYPVYEQDLYFQEVATQSIGSMFSNMNVKKLSQTANIMSSMASGRHFSMYAFDPAVEKTISGAGFTAQTPNSEEHPSVGVYVTEQNPSKMDWYIHRTSTVTRMSCNADSSQTYTVEYKLENTLNAKDGSSLPAYVSGVVPTQQTQGIEKVLIYAPAGGKIANLQTQGNVTQSRKENLNGKAINASLAQIGPGQAAVYSFDVTTSPKSVSDLTVDQTPMGWADAGVTLENSACAIGK